MDTGLSAEGAEGAERRAELSSAGSKDGRNPNLYLCRRMTKRTASKDSAYSAFEVTREKPCRAGLFLNSLRPSRGPVVIVLTPIQAFRQA